MEGEGKPFDPSELYSNRVVVLFEIDPLTDKYRQVMFTKEQFIKFSMFMSSMFAVATNGNNTVVDMPVIHKTEKLSGETQNFYDEDKIFTKIK